MFLWMVHDYQASCKHRVSDKMADSRIFVWKNSFLVFHHFFEVSLFLFTVAAEIGGKWHLQSELYYSASHCDLKVESSRAKNRWEFCQLLFKKYS